MIIGPMKVLTIWEFIFHDYFYKSFETFCLNFKTFGIFELTDCFSCCFYAFLTFPETRKLLLLILYEIFYKSFYFFVVRFENSCNSNDILIMEAFVT
jgi:hypothetical protein